MARIKALQERCLAKEEVVTRVRKHNATLMNEQGQYKEAMRTFNKEVKELKEKLAEAGSQKQKLQEEVTALREKVETAELTPSRSSKHRNRSLTPMLITTALVLMIASSK